ncbi:MAG: hypothetical protein AMXMBFR44_5660 [Candidatus Campbellbacteria bacterium]
MTVLASMFGGSILLISAFFAFKDWERGRGRETAFSALLNRYSPSVERLYRRVVAKIVFWLMVAVATVRALFRFGFVRALTLTRATVAVLGAHMIHVARGEHLIAEGKIPSTYFKLLHRHKERINGTDIPKGIIHQGIPQRVKVTVAEETSSATAPAQVE